MMFLWELKNGIISTNLRELCVIKINTKILPTVTSTSSATYSFITRRLRVVEGTFSLLISVPEPVEGTIISITLKSVQSIEHL